MNTIDSLDFQILPPPEFPDHATWKTFSFLGGLYLVWGIVASNDGREALGIARYDSATGSWAPVWQKTLGRQGEGGSNEVILEPVVAGSEVWVRIRTPRQTLVLRSSNGAYFTGSDAGLWPPQGHGSPEEVVRQGNWQVRCHQGVFEKAQSGSEDWEPLPRTGSEQSVAVFLLPLGGAVLAGIDDPVLGCRAELLKTDAAGELQGQPVFTRGAGLYTLAARLTGWVPLGEGALLMTAPLPEREPEPGIGFNLISVAPDGSWELLAGPPRVTPSGFRVPLTGRGAGLDEFQPGSTEFLMVRNGLAWLGTINVLEGFRILGSRDGIEWETLAASEMAGYQPVLAAHWIAGTDHEWVVMEIDNPAHGEQVRIAEVSRAAFLMEG